MRLLKLFIIICFGFVLAGCSDTYQWNEKVTLEVETPDGLKTASAVQSVTVVHTKAGLPEMKGVRVSIRGEAVVMEVSPGRYLFALLKGQDNQWQRFSLIHDRKLTELFREVIPPKKGQYKDPTQAERVTLTLKTKGHVIDIPKSYYPLLVAFKDIKDPATVEKVFHSDLAATFGPGIKLKRITIEVTDEPVTKGRVEKVLGWVGDPQYYKNPGWANLPSKVQHAISGLVDVHTTLNITKEWSLK